MRAAGQGAQEVGHMGQGVRPSIPLGAATEVLLAGEGRERALEPPEDSVTRQERGRAGHGAASRNASAITTFRG